ncbi:MAG: head decoration protein [Methylococcales bacterium]|nr:head decoration protein [Methylococcales bacterium]
MAAITSIEGNHNLEFVLNIEENSVDEGIIASGQNLVSGTVLGKIVANTTATASTVTGTGVLTITAGALGANAIVGTYRATCITAGATAVYEFETPTGVQLRQDMTVGAGSTDIDGHFTVGAVNGTNSVVGDFFTFTIASSTVSTISASAVVGTGNGVITAGAGGGLALDGAYCVVCTTAALNAGIFTVYQPLTNEVIGTVTVSAGATSVAGHFTLTIADGAADFVVGDRFVVTVSIPKPTYILHNPAAVDGSQNAIAVLCHAVDATSGALHSDVIARNALIYDSKLTWKSGITAAQKLAALASLESKLITVRT